MRTEAGQREAARRAEVMRELLEELSTELGVPLPTLR